MKPVKTDKVSLSRILYLKYTDYADRCEEIAGIFSRDAILKGSFDKYAESNKIKKGTTEVDAAFLQEIERWRELLARNIALRNPNLSQRELNFAKCGNSLIGPDFYDHQQMSLFDEEEIYRVNAFDWNAEFAEIMKDGGFDAVIGNPPYVRQESLTDFKPYFEKRFSVYNGVADLYVYFIEKGVSLLRQGGFFSYIVANKWFRANYGKPLRQWMKLQHILEIIDFGDLPVFKQATTYPCILVIQKKAPGPTFRAVTIKTLDFGDLLDRQADRSTRISFV